MPPKRGTTTTKTNTPGDPVVVSDGFEPADRPFWDTASDGVLGFSTGEHYVPADEYGNPAHWESDQVWDDPLLHFPDDPMAGWHPRAIVDTYEPDHPHVENPQRKGPVESQAHKAGVSIGSFVLGAMDIPVPKSWRPAQPTALRPPKGMKWNNLDPFKGGPQKPQEVWRNGKRYLRIVGQSTEEAMKAKDELALLGWITPL